MNDLKEVSLEIKFEREMFALTRNHPDHFLEITFKHLLISTTYCLLEQLCTIRTQSGSSSLLIAVTFASID